MTTKPRGRFLSRITTIRRCGYTTRSRRVNCLPFTGALAHGTNYFQGAFYNRFSDFPLYWIFFLFIRWKLDMHTVLKFPQDYALYTFIFRILAIRLMKGGDPRSFATTPAFRLAFRKPSKTLPFVMLDSAYSLGYCDHHHKALFLGPNFLGGGAPTGTIRDEVQKFRHIAFRKFPCFQ